MRLVPEIFEKVQSGRLVGDNRAVGRVTIKPNWMLKTTPPAYGSSIRGPYRYYDEPTTEEYEIPSIKSISINRSKGQDVARCDITLYNAWHEKDFEDPELAYQLGKPGFFWPKRGEGDSAATWNQKPGVGAYRRNGTWNPTFSWSNTIVEDGLLFTWQGYGRDPHKDGRYIPLQDQIDSEEVLITGVWLIDTVEAGSDGLMKISCRDIGRLLLDQIIFAGLVPPGLYPLDYFPAGKSAFDSFWGAIVKAKNAPPYRLSPSEKGEVWMTDGADSASGDPTVNVTHHLKYARDGNPNNYWLSQAFKHPNAGDTPWCEFGLHQGLSSIAFKPWAGGYTVYVCVQSYGEWIGDENVPAHDPALRVKYWKKVYVPSAIPDGFEPTVKVDIGNGKTNTDGGVIWEVDKVRIYFSNLYYSNLPDASGNQYRAGLREFQGYRNGTRVSPYDVTNPNLPWTFSMASHPTRGYWVCDHTGYVHGFGDAADYDSSSFSFVPLNDYGGNNRSRAMAAHPDGKGYWVIDWMGHVWAYGSAVDYGEFAVPDPWVPFGQASKVEATDIAATFDGKGYVVSYSDGQVRGFGNASSLSFTVPNNPLADFMEIWQQNNLPNNTQPYKRCLMARSVACHPKKLGAWVTDGSGQVWPIGSGMKKHGALINRVYRKGLAGSFKLKVDEYATKIEPTETGDGYWISFGSGRIASYGDAANRGPVDVYADKRALYEDNTIIDGEQFDASFFREIVWSIARDPSGAGFYVLSADGNVKAYNATYWGRPGYFGNSGYRWYEGNYSGDPIDVIKELLLWSGFLFKDPVVTPETVPSVLGRIEGTGIRTDSRLTGDKFDKKTVMDVIKELLEIVTYSFFITEEGGVNIASANIWKSGNYDENGLPIHVRQGTMDRVDADDPDAVEFIPVIHESADLLNYSVTISQADKRSELIIGSELPNPKDPSRTSFVRHVPPDALEQVRPGIPSNRGIQRPGIWISNMFESEVERQLMAELIGIHSWFAKRTGSTTCVGNPCLSLDDQVRIVERNTSETYIHLITAIDSNMDLDTGVWQMTLSHHWLGDADQWVIIADDSEKPDYPYVKISEQLDSWQSYTNQNLASGNAGNGNAYRTVLLTGEFVESVVTAGGSWSFGGNLTLNTFVNDLQITTNALPEGVASTRVRIYDEDDVLFIDKPLGIIAETVSLGSLGVYQSTKGYRYLITGTSQSVGAGTLRVTVSGSNVDPMPVEGSLLTVGA